MTVTEMPKQPSYEEKIDAIVAETNAAVAEAAKGISPDHDSDEDGASQE